MSRTAARSAARTAARRARWAAALAVAGLALAGCGAGHDAQTSEMAPAISGVGANAGSIALRDMEVDFGRSGSYRAGGAAPLRVWIANKGETALVLESVTSPQAETVTLATELTIEEIVEGAVALAEEPADGESESPSEDPSAFGESPSEDASPTEEVEVTEEVGVLLGERDFTLDLAPVSYQRLTRETGTFLLLEGLTEDLDMRSRVEVVFAFSNGESVSVMLPMGMPEAVESRSFFGEEH
ncbi:hypothetical protein [Glycomyces paridis]|uniref:Copper chaperone PCu(A)C n=1 Tax=Glycomyces paridis TaxID=2126555 RepID=A0A4S8P8M3_9ACTN|nr:hypothetical protein [Glycomyces paridis]THV25955.1 hypothetical protein E9998_19675 [Glycomyces paridis]